jgi:predicted phage terminase large subunit-like protein
VAITRGSTFDNAKNLAPSALLELQARYHGTRLGRQELYGEILEDQDGALWNRAMIEDSRIDQNKVPNLIRIVVAIDPAVTSGPDSDETGIVVAGLGTDNQYYILSDNSLRASPDAWARMAVEQYKEWKADRIIAEANNGGDMITQLIRTVDGQVPVKKVNATRGKKVRAEPISALYEQGRVHHVGSFPKLEDQMATWTPDTAKSPDRLDALVWALTELSEGSVASISLSSMSVWCPNCSRPLPKNTLSCPHCATNLGA